LDEHLQIVSILELPKDLAQIVAGKRLQGFASFRVDRMDMGLFPAITAARKFCGKSPLTK